MRERFYTPEAGQNLADLHAAKQDLDRIDRQLKKLAIQPSLGFRIPIQFLEWPDGLFQYQVGIFKLNYIFTDEEIVVISVTT